MIPIDNTIVSDEILDNLFCCDLSVCKGACCVEGNSGAPLEEEEIGILEDIMDSVKPYLTPEGREEIEINGVFDYDMTGSYCTPLIKQQNCAFILFENEVAKCAIEKAFEDGKIDFIKPISCHLYPIRITKFNDYEAINYHTWDICEPACIKGKKEKIRVYKFLKTPLIRNYGSEWYKKLEKEAILRKKF